MASALSLKNWALLALACGMCACSSISDWMGEDEETPLPGERVSIFAMDKAIQPDEAIKALPIALPELEKNSSWPQSGGRPGGGQGNVAAPSQFTVEKAEAGNGESFSSSIVPFPVVAEGLVFAMDAAGTVSAHKEDNIHETQWARQVTDPKNEGEVLGGGLAYADGVVVAVTGFGDIAALKAASGEVLWQRNIDIPLRAAPRIADGKVLAVTVDNQLLALDAATGKIQWQHNGFREAAAFLGGASPAVSGRMVVVPYSSGDVYGVGLGIGAEKWQDSLSSTRGFASVSVLYDIDADPLIVGDRVYVTSTSGEFAALELESGRRLWSRDIASFGSPWAAGDFLFVLTARGDALCIHAPSGKVKWVAALPRDKNQRRQEWFGPVLAGGRLLLSSPRGEMLALSPEDGKTLATIDIPEGVLTAPVVAGGKIFLLTRKAQLVALQ